MMVPISNILSAVADLLSTAFIGETVYTNHVRKGFSRPSCLVFAGKLAVQPVNQSYEQRTVEVCIQTFVEVDERYDSHFQSLLDRAEDILSLFSSCLLRVGTRSLTVLSANCEYEFDLAEVKVLLTWSEEKDNRATAPTAAQYNIHPERLEC